MPAQNVIATGGPANRFRSLEEARAWFVRWLNDAALPLWASDGVDRRNGGFREGLTWRGSPYDPRRRARVQARQAYVFATAAERAGGASGWLATARAGLDFFLANGRRADELFACSLDVEGGVTDDTPRLYEHAFLLLAFAAMRRAAPGEDAWTAEATAVRERLDRFRHFPEGFREAGDQPFQANAHMHLLEAALAWTEAGGDPGWAQLAEDVATLALRRFVDPASGAVREFFDADWRALPGEAGLIEPGHQFEWAWLLNRWGDAAAARRLFAVGLRGLDPERGVVVDALRDDLTLRDAAARLWPQTEWLKASLELGEEAQALAAANGLAQWLATPVEGVWRERMRPDGSWVEQPSPATSLYHVAGAIWTLERAPGKPC